MKKTMLQYWHQLCGVYTVAALLLLLFNLALGSSMTQTTVNSAAFLWLFLFAAFLSAANLQLRLCSFALIGRVLLHCFVTVGGGFCFLYLPTNTKAVASSKLLMLLLMLVAYWVVMALYLVLRPKESRAAHGGKDRGSEPYRSVFGNK